MYIYICKILIYGGLFGRKVRKYRYVERGKQSPSLLGSLYPRAGACSLVLSLFTDTHVYIREEVEYSGYKFSGENWEV